MTKKPTCLGYTDTNTIKIDIDNVKYDIIENCAKYFMKKYKLEGYIILESSKEKYHLMFNKSVSWKRNINIVARIINSLRYEYNIMKWFTLQCIKQSSTLRMSEKGDKLSPRIITIVGKQDKEIKNYLDFRKLFDIE